MEEEWGDYYFAKSMIKEFKKQDINCRMQFLNQWYEDDSDADVVITLRGLSIYKVKDYHFNIMWNISHPDKITLEEYYSYDTVYIASVYLTNIVKNRNINSYTCIETLLQCTDIDIFKPYTGSDYNHELLFVGNSRKIYNS